MTVLSLCFCVSFCLPCRYGFKTVDYFLGSDTIMSRRVRHLNGLRFIFDVTGSARRFSQVVLMTTIVSGFGFAALAFVIVNEARFSCEKKGLMEKKWANKKNKKMHRHSARQACLGGMLQNNNKYGGED